MSSRKELIEKGKTVLGIEFGSTRIKAVLIDENHHPIASGDHEWENRLENGIWTYSLDDIWQGLRDSYQKLAFNVEETYGVTLKKIGAIGFSAMMHGYMAFDKNGELLVPFRTWRNGITGEASEALTEAFQYNIPQRWSIAHLYQAILNGEDHVKDIEFFTTLAGYIHWKLTGQKVLGIGDASGMFPIDPETKQYHAAMIQKFDLLVADKNYPWKLKDILPKILVAGENAGTLTPEGAKLLDPSGNLEAGIPLCPPVGMVHANNCTSDLNAWVGLFREFAESFGMEVDMNQLFGTLYNKALEGDKDCGGLLSYGYLSGENITGVTEGRPLFVRSPESRFNLANFMRTHLYTSLGALKVGMDILLKEEHVQIDKILGHGGLFKTKGVGQGILAAAIDTPVSVMETAGEGGPWGMALLASYMLNKESDETLAHYLSEKVFVGNKGTSMDPDPEDVKGFETFIERYKKGIAIEKAALENLIV